MRSVKLWPYLFLATLLGLFIFIPRTWKTSLQTFASSFFSYSLPLNQDQMTALYQENRALKEELAKYKAEFANEKWMARQLQYLKELKNREIDEPHWQAFFARRAKSLSERLERNQLGIGANVILRDPNFWSSYLWIDAGTNVGVEKNFPVVVRNSLIGVIDEVEEHRSKVRLITDIQLTPSVRAVRGEQGARYLMQLSDQLLEILYAKRGLLSTPQIEELTIKSIENLKINAVKGWGDHYLAKGEICGSSFPLWRSRKPLLKGKGFNYDFPDVEGVARDLRFTGSGIPLLLAGDLLVTSGLDGVFPEGLEVGIVTKVNLLREGDYSYDLEAVPTFNHFDDLREVWVMFKNK
jgi:rod shape-determining protein MreC